MRFSLSRAFDFAHLGGTPASAEETERDLRLINGHAASDAPPARAEGNGDKDDDEHKRKDGESDDEYAERMKKLDEDEAKKKGKKKASSDDNDDDDDGDCADDPKEEASARVRKAEARGGRKMQRRIGKILSSQAAARNMKLAAKLACNTQMSADEALIIIEESPASRGLNERMQHAPRGSVPPGNGKPAGGEAAVDALWSAALTDMIPAKQ